VAHDSGQAGDLTKEELVDQIATLIAAYQDGHSIGDKRFDRVSSPFELSAFLVERLQLRSSAQSLVQTHQ
jgi:hypothetical protein